jgi:hypothetical protein
MSQTTNTDLTDKSNMLNNGLAETDIKADNNLLNSAETTKEVQTKILTEVTSIAKEEARTGQQINIPTGEELYNKATGSFIRNMKHLNDLINKTKGSGSNTYAVSRKGMNRVLNAILQLPMDGLPVTLQGEEEKMLFALGQRIIADRYLITHQHILEERKRLQAEKNSATNKEQTNGENQKGDKNE